MRALLQYLDVLTAGAASCRFFLPLCGKAPDLLHLYNLGHTVTGVEGVPFVVEQFFRESKLDYEKISMPEIKGWKFKVTADYLMAISSFINQSSRSLMTFCMEELL